MGVETAGARYCPVFAFATIAALLFTKIVRRRFGRWLSPPRYRRSARVAPYWPAIHIMITAAIFIGGSCVLMRHFHNGAFGLFSSDNNSGTAVRLSALVFAPIKASAATITGDCDRLFSKVRHH